MADSPDSLPKDVSSGREAIGDEELSVLRRLHEKRDWAGLRKNCGEALRSKAPDLRIALWWVEANTNLQEFKGVAEGVWQISGLWSRLAEGVRYDNDRMEELVTTAADALETYLLQVPLAEGWFTFTTVINSRSNPELASEVQREVAKHRDGWKELTSELQEIESALLEFQVMIGSASRTVEAFRQWKKTLSDMIQTVSGWAAAEGEPGPTPAEPAASSAPAREPDYVIHLKIEGVTGESAAPHHYLWIEGLAYKQLLRNQTGAEEAGQPTFEIEKYLDLSSPALYHAVHFGRVFDTVVVEVCRGTEQAERFLRIEMSDAVIKEVRQSATSSSGHSRPVETVVFGYRKIQWTYTKLRQSDAVREGNTSSTWTCGTRNALRTPRL